MLNLYWQWDYYCEESIVCDCCHIVHQVSPARVVPVMLWGILYIRICQGLLQYKLVLHYDMIHVFFDYLIEIIEIDLVRISYIYFIV